MVRTVRILNRDVRRRVEEINEDMDRANFFVGRSPQPHQYPPHRTKSKKHQ